MTVTLATNVNLTGGVSDTSGTSPIIFATGAGTLNNAGDLVVGDTLTIAGGIITSNNSTTSPFTCNTPTLTGSAVNMTSGTLTLLNDSTCSPLSATGVFATSLATTDGLLNVSGGTINFTNNATIDATSSPNQSEGAVLIGRVGGVTISGGTVTGINNGSVSTASGNVGVDIWNFDSVGGVPLTFSGGTVTMTNNGTITAGVGAKLTSGNGSTVSSPINVEGTASVTLTNAANLNGGAFQFGGGMFGNELTVSAGSLTLTNTGNLGLISAFPSFGVFTDLTSITLEGTGSMEFSNSGTVNTAGTDGAAGGVIDSTFTQTGTSSFTMQNTGNITAGSTSVLGFSSGAVVGVGGATSLGGTGTVDITNSGDVTAAISYGDYFSCSGVTFAGAAVTMTNSGPISAPTTYATGSAGVYFSMSSLATSGTGGSLSMTNSGIVSASPLNIGTSLLSSGTMTLGAGTWTAANDIAITNGIGVRIEGQADRARRHFHRDVK
jgi:hypothetical protein